MKNTVLLQTLPSLPSLPSGIHVLNALYFEQMTRASPNDHHMVIYTGIVWGRGNSASLILRRYIQLSLVIRKAPGW